MPGGPSFLRASVQSMSAGQQADVLEEAAKIRPLGWAHDAIDRNKQSDRRIIKKVIAGKLAIAGGTVFAWNVQRCVELLADAKAAGGIWVFFIWGGELIFGTLPPPQFFFEERAHVRLSPPLPP